MFYLLQYLKTRGKYSIWNGGIGIALQVLRPEGKPQLSNLAISHASAQRYVMDCNGLFGCMCSDSEVNACNIMTHRALKSAVPVGMTVRSTL